VIGLVKEGKLRAIGFSGAKPFPELLNVPLVRDSVPSFSLSGTWGMFFAPAKTPQPIIDKLNGAVRHALHAKTVANVVQRGGYVPDERDAAATAAFFRKEVVVAGEAVKAAHIQPQ
jgi:tripartite-type tricarboxylate transporter receptor subunit TctC